MPRYRWWQAVPEEDELNRQAERFARWAEQQRNPPPEPWKPPEEPPAPSPRGPITGPAAAGLFADYVGRTRQLWQDAVLGASLPPADTLQAGPQYTAEVAGPEVPRSPQPAWQEALTGGLERAGGMYGATQELAPELTRAIRGSPLQTTPERRRELASQVPFEAASFAAAEGTAARTAKVIQSEIRAGQKAYDALLKRMPERPEGLSVEKWQAEPRNQEWHQEADVLGARNRALTEELKAAKAEEAKPKATVSPEPGQAEGNPLLREAQERLAQAKYTPKAIAGPALDTRGPGAILSEIDGRPAWSNGHIIEVAKPPAELTKLKNWRVNEKRPPFKSMVPTETTLASIVGAVPDEGVSSGLAVVLTSPEGSTQVVDSTFYAYFRQRYPGAQWHVSRSSPNHPLTITQGNQLVGVVMPLHPETLSLGDLLAAWRESPAVPAVAQTGPEAATRFAQRAQEMREKALAAPAEAPPAAAAAEVPETTRSEGTAPTRPIPESVTSRRQIPSSELSTEQLVARIKTMSSDPQAAYGLFVRERALKPEIDMKEFRAIWGRVSANPYVEVTTKNFHPTHIDTLNPDKPRYVRIVDDERGVHNLLWENGYSGSDLPGPLPERYQPINAEMARPEARPEEAAPPTAVPESPTPAQAEVERVAQEAVGETPEATARQPWEMTRDEYIAAAPATGTGHEPEELYPLIKKLAQENLQGDRVIVRDLDNFKEYIADTAGNLFEAMRIKGSGGSTAKQIVAYAQGNEANYGKLEAAMRKGRVQIEKTSSLYDYGQHDYSAANQIHATRIIVKADPVGKAGPDVMSQIHRWDIERALSEGKPVPESVLADYPDLAAQYGKKAAEAPGPGRAPEVTPTAIAQDLAQATNAKTWYHGSGTPGLTAATLDPFLGRMESLFGYGVYLTDNPQVATGYARTRGKQTKTPTLYGVSVNVGRVLDLEVPLPADARQAIESAVKDWPEVTELLPEASRQPGVTGETLLEGLRKAVEENSGADMVPDYEYTNMFKGLAMALRSAGYDALTHTGGKRVGKTPHKVLILLDPNDIYSRTGRGQQVARMEETTDEVERVAQEAVGETVPSKLGPQPITAASLRTMSDEDLARLTNQRFDPENPTTEGNLIKAEWERRSAETESPADLTGGQRALYKVAAGRAAKATDGELVAQRADWASRKATAAVRAVDDEMARRQGPAEAPAAEAAATAPEGPNIPPTGEKALESPPGASEGIVEPATAAQAPTAGAAVDQQARFLKEIRDAQTAEDLLDIPDRIKATGVSDTDYLRDYAPAYRTRRQELRAAEEAAAQAPATGTPAPTTQPGATTPPAGQVVSKPATVKPRRTPPPEAPPSTQPATPAEPDRILGHLRPGDEMDALIRREGVIKSAAETVSEATRGLAKGPIGILDPGLVALQAHERVPIIQFRLESQADTIRQQAHSAMAAAMARVKGVKVENGRFSEGVTPKKPDLSLAVMDVAEYPDRYDMPQSLRDAVGLLHQMEEELKGDAWRDGVRIRLKKYEEGGHHVARVVEEIKGLETKGKKRFDLARKYETAEEGLLNRILYGDLLDSADATVDFWLRKGLNAKMKKLTASMGKTPTELIGSQLTEQATGAAKLFQRARNYERLVRNVRDGLPYYQPETMFLRPPLRAMYDLVPGLKDRFAAAVAAKGPARKQQFQALLTEATDLVKETGHDYRVAKSARARAIESIQGSEWAITGGAAFGRPDEVLKAGRVRQPWAQGRLFPEDVAKYLNDRYGREQSKVTKVAELASGTARTMGTAVDLGTAFLHGLPAMAKYPAAWWKGVNGMLRYAIVNPKGYAEELAKPDNMEFMRNMAHHGLSLEGPDYLEALERGGLFEMGAQALGKVAGKRAQTVIEEQILDRARLAFEAPLNIIKLEVGKSLYKKFEVKGQLDDLGTYLNNLTGTRALKTIGIGPGQRSVESLFAFFSPRYTRTLFALIGDAMQGGLKGGEARGALGRMAAVTVLAPVALRGVQGYVAEVGENGNDPSKVDVEKVWEHMAEALDPIHKPELFATADIFGHKVGWGTGYRSLATLVAMSLRAAEEDPEAFLAVKDRRRHPLTRWWTGRASPATTAIWNSIEGRDFIGEPYGWGEAVKQTVLPIWARQGITAGTPLEFVGLRANPKTPAESRDEIRERLAQETYQLPWDKLSRPERYRLQEQQPELAKATTTAQETGERRGYLESRFWSAVDDQRADAAKRVEQANQQLRAGKLSGNQYRDLVADAEKEMAQAPVQLKKLPEYKDMPLTEVERQAKYKDYQPSEHPVDLFLEAYYALAQLATDKETMRVDPVRLSDLRERLKKRADPQVVKEALDYVSRNRDPEYAQAQAAMRELMQIPRWAGVDLARSRKLDEAYRQYRAVADKLRQRSPGATVSQNTTLGELQKSQGKEMATLAYEALKRPRNPEWKRFRQGHADLFDRFYSDLAFMSEEPEAQATRAAATLPQLTPTLQTDWRSALLGVR